MIESFPDHSFIWYLSLAVALLTTGVIAGLLAGLLGVGGGIVIVPVLYHVFTLLGIDETLKMHIAVGTSLATIVPTSIASSIAHYKKGNIDKNLVSQLIPGVLVGVIVGTYSSGLISSGTLTIIFAVIALMVAVNMILGSKSFQISDRLPPRPGTTLIATCIGSLSALMGIGGGTLSVPILNAFKVPMHKAVGTGAALGILISVPGAAGFIYNGLSAENLPPLSIGYLNLIGFALITPTTMKMAPIGAEIGHKIDQNLLKRLFAVFLGLTSLKMFYALI